MKKLSVTYISSDIKGIGIPPQLLSEFGASYGDVFKTEFESGMVLAARAVPVPFAYHTTSTIVLPDYWQTAYNIGDVCFLDQVEPRFTPRIQVEKVELDLEGNLPLFDGTLYDKSVVFRGKLFSKDYSIYRVIDLSPDVPYGIVNSETIIAAADTSHFDVEQAQQEEEKEVDDDENDASEDSGAAVGSSSSGSQNGDPVAPEDLEDIETELFLKDYSRNRKNKDDEEEEDEQDTSDSESLDDYVNREHNIQPLTTGSGRSGSYQSLKKMKGIDDAVNQLIIEVIEPFSDVLAGRSGIPLGGVLLYGPPGCGKTEIAYSLASTLGVKFYKMDLGDISSPYIHETNRIISTVFSKAAQHKQGAVLFIDEIDSLAGKRDDLRNFEREVVNTLLQELDPKKRPAHVLVVAATNSLSSLDTAITRSGRFDTKIAIPPPDRQGRFEILKSKLLRLPLNNKEITTKYVEKLAKDMVGYVGSDIITLVDKTEAFWRNRGRKSRSSNKILVNRSDIEQALESVVPLCQTELNISSPKTKRQDLPGLEAIIDEVVSEFEYRMSPEKFRSDLTFQSTNGVLLYGPPGTGKTSIASAIANELNVLFLAIKAGELKSKHVGETGKNINDLFEKARLFRPILVYFDEIDSLGMDRSMSQDSHGNDSINALLSELSGENDNHQILLMASTNRKDLLDSALLRNERFGNHINVDIPDFEQYKKQAHHHLKEIPHKLTSKQIDELCAKFESHQFSQADVFGYFQNVLKYLVLHTRKGVKATHQDFENELQKLTQDEVKSV